MDRAGEDFMDVWRNNLKRGELQDCHAREERTERGDAREKEEMKRGWHDFDLRENGRTKTGVIVGCNCGPQLPDEIVLELLTRLPVKKISQCKCVSKGWLSLIVNPSFAQSYRKRNPLCLVSSVPIRQGRRIRIFHSTFGSQPEPSVKLLDVSLIGKKKGKTIVGLGRLTQVVNGLFCYYSRNRLFLSNIFTGESMRLPLPDVPADGGPDFYFGFDTVNRVYKLLCLTFVDGRRRLHKHPRITTCQCDILTLGSNNPSWRRLPDSECPLHFNRGCVFVNGALYWISDAKYDFSRYEVDCFNLTDEKFMSLRVYMLEREAVRWAYLVQFRGRLSLLACLRENMIIYTNGDDEWTRHEAFLPGELWRDDSDTVVPVGNLPTGEMLLMNPNIDDSVFPIYSYNDRNNKFERFVVGKLPKSLHLKNNKVALGVVSCMEQNIETLDALLHGGGVT